MPLQPDIVAAIAQRLAEHAGLELPAWVVDARASARIALLGLEPDDYVALIDGRRGAAELGALIEAVRVGESRLFRHRSQVDVLADVIAPALAARGQRTVRVWSAGCAAGEEPYTLAIVLQRALPGCAISILATDVSAEALAQAAARTYPRAQLAHVPAAYRDGFVVDGEAVRVAPELAALVRFERANLLDGAAPRGCDLVWCRNVLIYFTADARRRVIDRLVSATVPGGFVFVGYSESLRDVPELEAMRASDAVYYVRRGAEAARRSPLEPAPHAGSPSSPIPLPVIRGVQPGIQGAGVPAGPAPPAVPGVPAAGDRPAAPATFHEDRTPPPIRFSAEPPPDDTVALRGQPAAAHVTAELSARLAQPGLRTLTIDLDGADLLDDDLAPVLRRVRAAARIAGIALVVRATRAGTRRWLARHGLDEEAA
ncbi:MAG TPA: CheR family methyltransferase [Kofleriaceae bacterium]|nr:CheR family methyltransferase [Kofleriaceae bacterium]